jgi:hypothetical protein
VTQVLQEKVLVLKRWKLIGASKVINESKGILIALEGMPNLQYMLSNSQLRELRTGRNNLLKVEYVSQSSINTGEDFSSSRYLKYHPRRERYTIATIIEHSRNVKPQLIVLDTVLFPNFSVVEYMELVESLSETEFIFAHSFGLELSQYLGLLSFSRVYFDFSKTLSHLKFHNHRD